MVRILVIDDHTEFLGVLRKSLELMGHEVVCASDGRAGLRSFFKGPAFDLVITDVVMPEMEGLETLLALKRHSPGLKVVVMSGGGRVSPDEYLQIAVKLGADRTLKKPFSHQELRTVVRHFFPESADHAASSTTS